MKNMKTNTMTDPMTNQPAPSDTPRVSALLQRFCKEFTPTMQCHDLSALAKELELECSRLSAEREKLEGAYRHMNACRALLKTPEDDVLYSSIEELLAEREKERELREKADGFREELREKLNDKANSLAQMNHEYTLLRATLAERDNQLAEANAQLEAARTQCELRSAGHDDLRTRLNKSRAEWQESLRQLEEKDKRENELIAQLAASERQRKEMEVKVRSVLGEHEDWRLTRVAWLHCLIKELRNNDAAFRLLADDDPQALLECIGEAEALAKDGHELLQSLRSTPETKE